MVCYLLADFLLLTVLSSLLWACWNRVIDLIPVHLTWLLCLTRNMVCPTLSTFYVLQVCVIRLFGLASSANGKLRPLPNCWRDLLELASTLIMLMLILVKVLILLWQLYSRVAYIGAPLFGQKISRTCCLWVLDSV